MKEIKLAIIDDEPLAHKVLENHCEKIDYVKVVANCYDGTSAINLLNSQPIDAILLDIQMPELTGFELIDTFQSSNAPKVIFTTSFTKYAFESFNYEFVVDYLHKPIKLVRFVKSINRLRNLLELEKNFVENRVQDSIPKELTKKGLGSSFYIKDGKTLHMINYEDIMYLQAYGNYIKFFLKNGDIKISRDTISNAMLNLPDDMFCRIHKSYSVNLEAITKVIGNQINLSEETLPIGKNYREYFKQRITGHNKG